MQLRHREILPPAFPREFKSPEHSVISGNETLYFLSCILRRLVLLSSVLISSCYSAFLLWESDAASIILMRICAMISYPCMYTSFVHSTEEYYVSATKIVLAISFHSYRRLRVGVALRVFITWGKTLKYKLGIMSKHYP